MLAQLIILLLLGGLAYGAYRVLKARQSHAAERPDTRPQLLRLAPGAVLQLPAIGDDMAEQDVQVSARHRYVEDGYTWTEYACDAGDARYHLDVEYDDELETSVTLARINLDEIGVSPDEFDSVREITYQGQTYRRGESGRAHYYANGEGAGEAYEYRDFNGEGPRSIALERWGDDCRAYLTQALNPDRIRIYSEGGTDA